MITEKITVIFYILLSLICGIGLTLAPWLNWGGFGDVVKDIPFLNALFLSGWFRGAVSGLGILNIFLAILEMANFSKNVKALQSQSE